jgi:hypothetical protein
VVTTVSVGAAGDLNLQGDESGETTTISESDSSLNNVVGTFIDDEVLNVIGWDLTIDDDTTDHIQGDIAVQGAVSGATAEMYVYVEGTWSFGPWIDDETLTVTGSTIIADVSTSTSTTTAAIMYTGVARTLTPASTPCCAAEVWDYLHMGVTVGAAQTDGECFSREPSALRICGCISADTNSVLWAIDNECYQVSDGLEGTLWQYEDCLAKAGVTLISPKDGATVACEACPTCTNAPITLKWERLCLACSYDVQVALDEGFTEKIISKSNFEPTSGANPAYIIDPGELTCGRDYYWRVRVSDAETNEYIKSWWSSKWSFTIEAAQAVGLILISPEVGSVDQPVEGVAFSWTSVNDATSYNFVLSQNADLSSPLLSKTGLTGTALAYAEMLDYTTAYYWQVVALKGANVLSTSSVGTFITAAKPVEPAPPVVIPPTPPAPEPIISPLMIWIIIGIGAVLIIALIVLIVRTRRVV